MPTLSGDVFFYFNSLEHGEENFIEYLDNTYIGFNYLQRDSLKDSLDVGNTYVNF